MRCSAARRRLIAGIYRWPPMSCSLFISLSAPFLCLLSAHPWFFAFSFVFVLIFFFCLAFLQPSISSLSVCAFSFQRTLFWFMTCHWSHTVSSKALLFDACVDESHCIFYLRVFDFDRKRQLWLQRNGTFLKFLTKHSPYNFNIIYHININAFLLSIKYFLTQKYIQTIIYMYI